MRFPTFIKMFDLRFETENGTKVISFSMKISIVALDLQIDKSEA